MLKVNPLTPAEGLPWVGIFGALNLNNLVAGVLYPSALENGGSNTAALGQIPCPATGGKLRAILAYHRSGPLAGATVTYTVFVNGIATVLTVIIPAATNPRVQLIQDVIIPPAASPPIVQVNWAANVAPGAGTLRPYVTVLGTFNPQ